MVAYRNRSSTLATMVVGSAWLVLLLGSSVDARMSGIQDYHRSLPEVTEYYEYYSKKSKTEKESKKGSKSYYSVVAEEIDSNHTNIEAGIIVVDEDSKSYKSKGSKSGYASYTKSDKKEKSVKKEKSDKKDKSHKFDKKIKSDLLPVPPVIKTPDVGFDPEEEWNRTFKNAVGTGFLFYDPITKYAWYAYNARVGEDATVSVSSAAKVNDSNSRHLSSDDVSPVDASSDDEGANTNAAVAASSDDEGANTNAAVVVKSDAQKVADPSMTATVTAAATPSTIGRICPMDTNSMGKVLEDFCIEVKAPDDWKTVTSTKIIAVEACYGTVTNSMFKLAVIVEDSSKVLHLEDLLVGSRMIVYDIVVAGKNSGTSGSGPIIAEVAYEGWKSLYGEPTINGRPAFSPNCKQVYATWLTANNEVVDLSSSITVATDVESATTGGDSAELWRLGTSGRLVGLTPSKDGKSLISATNVPESDTLNSGGIVSLNARTGQIDQEYAFPTNSAGIPHNAYTNPVMDDSGNSYYIDSILGLVKFDSDDLNDGPIWSAVEGLSANIPSVGSDDIATMAGSGRMLDSAPRPRDTDSKLIIEEDEVEVVTDVNLMLGTAFQPGLDGSNFTTVYGCGNTALDGDSEVGGVIAVDAKNGEAVWFRDLEDHHVLNVGSCSGITGDIIAAPSVASSSGNAVYIVRGTIVQALDSKDGSPLWTYDMGDHGGVTKFVVVSDKLVLVVNTGTIVALETIVPAALVPSPVPTTKAPATSPPSRSPLANPTPVTSPTLVPMTMKPSSASRLGLSYVAIILSALPLLLVLLR